MVSEKASVLHLNNSARFPQYIYVLRMILTTKCHYFPKQESQFGLYNRDCVLCEVRAGVSYNTYFIETSPLYYITPLCTNQKYIFTECQTHKITFK